MRSLAAFKGDELIKNYYQKIINIYTITFIWYNNSNRIEVRRRLAMENRETIIINTTVNAPIEKVWKYFNDPEHIKKWNNASEDWHTTSAENDLRPGGKFSYRMEAKNGSFGFDFYGIYDEVKLYDSIAYTLGDDRKVKITFVSEGNKTEITESFEAEATNSTELQRAGWQSILDNFKRYTEDTV